MEQTSMVVIISIGLTIPFYLTTNFPLTDSLSIDTDGDQIPDLTDPCPLILSNQCLIDIDKDGIPDLIDLCRHNQFNQCFK